MLKNKIILIPSSLKQPLSLYSLFNTSRFGLTTTKNYDYDYFVIGGGSAGCASAIAASNLQAKVGLADYVTPSPQGTQWNLGGTCINVGCVPKKLFHYAALCGELKHDLYNAGWSNEQKDWSHDWERMTTTIKKHIFGIYWGAKKSLYTKGVKVEKKLASLEDEHTIRLFDPTTDEKRIVTAKNILICTGGRPQYLGIPGSELAITSDDIFYLSKNPGKTLIVGASYVGLETAGFLRGFGNDVTVAVRSRPLSDFDQSVTKRIQIYMEKQGVKFLNKFIPVRLDKMPSGKIKVTLESLTEKKHIVEEYDTVMYATGRIPNTSNLGLEKVGIKTDKATKKIIVNEFEQTNIPNIFSLGDCAFGRPELTPPAVRAGKLLAHRLFGGSNKVMDYTMIPTTIFTPLEYGCVGYSEEKAVAEFGEQNVIAYHGNFSPLEWVYNNDRAEVCYLKMICLKNEEEKVIGMHYLGPNAGEVIQGYAVGVKAGLKRKDFMDTLGIHPTCSEEFMNLTFTTKEELPELDETCAGCGF